MAGLVDKLAAAVPGWGVKLAYGEKVEVGGTELVPVALAGFGFGAGSGEGAIDSDKTGSGEGGGGGGVAIPIGAYVGEEGGLVFRPNPVTVALIAIPLVCAVGLAVSRILKAAS